MTDNQDTRQSFPHDNFFSFNPGGTITNQPKAPEPKPAAPVIERAPLPVRVLEPYVARSRAPNRTRIEMVGDAVVSFGSALVSVPGALGTWFHQNIWCPHRKETISRSDSSKVTCTCCGRRRDRTYRGRPA